MDPNLIWYINPLILIFIIDIYKPHDLSLGQ